MQTFPFVIAWRYLMHAHGDRSISTMLIISFLSIFIGSFSLTLVTAIMRGFEIEVTRKMQSIHAPLIIRAHGQPLDYSAIERVLHDEFSHLIEAVSPSTCAYTFAFSRLDKHDDAPILIVLKAIDPVREATTSQLAQKVITPVHPSSEILATVMHDDRLLIGKRLAKILGVQSGNSLEIHYPDMQNQNSKQANLLSTTATIGGIFNTGIDEFDTNVAFCTFNFFKQYFPDEVTEIHVRLKPAISEQQTTSLLRQRLTLDVQSWRDLYPALVSALALEKYVSFIVIALITLVAGMNIISLLFMEITNKRADIAILRVLGASIPFINTIFVAITFLITLSAAGIGILSAYIVSLIFAHYPFIRLPDVYYVSHVPACMSWSIAGAVFLVVIVVSILAAWLPIRKIGSFNIARILRAEG